MNADLPTPKNTETFERYAVRAHKQLLAAGVKDPDVRNQAVEQTWRRYRGLTETEELAENKLGKNHKRHRNVPIFAEHETVGNDGKPKHYGLRELVQLCQDANDRIADREAFPAISQGHTTDDPQHPDQDPPTLGYAGNYRLGMIGRKKPVWAIFQDEYHKPEAVNELKRRQRRSVEVWQLQDGTRYFDPIAALGGEAPRLPLPVKLSRRTHRETGAVVTRYSLGAAAPVAAGGVNTSPKQFGCGTDKRKPQQYQQEPDGMTGEDIKHVMAALMETPQFAWITQQMEAESAAEAPDKFQAEAEAPAVDPAGFDEGADDDTVDLATLLGPDGEEGAATPPGLEADDYMADADPMFDEEEPVAKMSQRNAVTPERYAQLQKSHVALQGAHKQLHDRYSQLSGQVQELRKESEDAKREATLGDLHRTYPHFIDLEEERAACLYSQGSQMDNASFTAHVAQLDRYAQRSAPVSPMLPRGELDRGRVEQPGTKTEAERYSQRAVEISTQAANRGEFIDYEDALAQAKAEK